MLLWTSVFGPVICAIVLSFYVFSANQEKAIALNLRIKNAERKINKTLFKIAGYSLCLLVIAELATIVLRYVFGVTFGWLDNCVTFSFATIFTLGAAYSFDLDAHVRLDVFYDKMSPNQKHIINLAGAILFLIPVCSFIVVSISPALIRSWQHLERFNSVDGLPLKYLFKTLVPILALSLLYQSFVQVAHASLKLRMRSIESPRLDQTRVNLGN